MKAAPFVILTIVLASCAPKAPVDSIEGPASESKQGKTVDVEILGATMKELQDMCAGGNKPARTVYVATPSGQVFHCVAKGKLTPHVDHGPTSDLSPADVELSAGDRVRWFSTTHTFYVESVVQGKEPPRGAGAPPTPFPGHKFALVPSKEVESGEVTFIDGKTVQRYKITFFITGMGKVDPDIICTM